MIPLKGWDPHYILQNYISVLKMVVTTLRRTSRTESLKPSGHRSIYLMFFKHWLPTLSEPYYLIIFVDPFLLHLDNVVNPLYKHYHPQCLNNVKKGPQI